MKDPIERQDAIDAMMKLQAEDIEAYGASIPEGFDGDRAVTALKALPPAQPELVEKVAYIRGFEQGRTQGMIDAKAEEVSQPNLQPTCNQLATDTIRRRAAINAVTDELDMIDHVPKWVFDRLEKRLKQLSSAQPEIIRCKDCKHFAGEGMYCSCNIIVQFDHFYCYYAERKEDD